MSIKLNIQKVSETISAYDKLIASLDERCREVSTVRNQAAGSWKGAASLSWQSRMNQVCSNILTPTRSELVTVRRSLEQVKQRAEQLRRQAERFGSDLGGGGGGGGDSLVLEDGSAGQVHSAASAAKQAIMQQGRVWSELQSAASGLALGGVSLDGGLSGRLSSDCSKIDAFESSFSRYRQGISEIGSDISAALGHLDPNKGIGVRSPAAAGFCSYFSGGGASSLRGLKVFSNILAADPVNTANGNFVYQTTEMSVFGSSPLSFSRTYNSLGKEPGELGLGWTHNWALRLVDEGGRIELSCADGSSKLFISVDKGVYVTKTEIEETLRKTDEGYLLVDAESVEHLFGENGLYLGYRASSGARAEILYDEEGHISRIENGVGGHFVFERDDKGCITRISDHTGRSVSYGYEKDKLAVFENECGRVYRYSYDAAGNLTSVVNPRGVCILEQGFDEQDRVVWQELACRDRVEFAYDGEMRETTVSSNSEGATVYGADDLGRTVAMADSCGKKRFAYDGRGLKTLDTDRMGAESRIHYDARGLVSFVEDAAGTVTRYSYTGEGAIASAATAGTELLNFEYGENFLPERISGPEGMALELKYNENGGISEIRDAAGNWSRFVYDESGNLEALEGAGGAVMRYGYDPLGRVVRVEETSGTVRERAYDDMHRLVRTEGPEGSWSFEYDGSGNLVRSEGPEGASWHMTYNDANDLETVIDPRGYKVSFSYDGAGRRSGAADETGTLFASEFDESGNVIRARVGTGEETCLSYNPEGRLIDVSRNGNLTARYSYGNDGLLASAENASGYKFKYARDAFGRPLCLYDEKGSLLEAIYDKAGRLVSLCDSTGAKRRYGWDADGLLSRVQDEKGLEVGLLRNPVRLVSEVVRSAGDKRRVERIDYDERDRAILVVDAAGRKTSYDYDGAGRPCRMVDRGGSVYERSYDGAGRLSEVSLPDGSKIGYSYDAAGALIGLETSKGKAYIERGLDGRVLAVERSNQPAFGYKRDGVGRMIARTYADAPAEKFSFDERGQLSSMARDKAEVSYGYDELGRLVERRLGSSVVERYAYDMRNLLVNYTLEATGEVVRACRYERDRAGRKIAEEVSEGGSTTNCRFVYDSCGRLSEVEENGVLKARYSYDAFGNRSSMDSDAGRVEYTYDECDRLLSERSEGGETHYSYDPCGRLVSIDGERGSHSYSYDDAGRLVDAETPKGAVSFKHDELGKRKKSKRAGRTEKRACDPLRPYNDTTWVEGRAYLFDVSLSAAVEEDGSVLYVACDELGSPTHVFDEDGVLLQAYSYDEFGVEKETHTERLIPFGFTGYEMDGTGMLFAQARQYDPRTGRFCSEDVVRGTVARPQTLNRYSYCQGNPIGLVDRDGREASSGNLLDMWDQFYKDNYGEESTDITMPTLGDFFGFYEGGRSVTQHAGGEVFIKTQDKLGDVVVSEGGKFAIPNTASIGWFGGINGYGLNASIQVPLLNLIGVNLGIDASLSFGGMDGISLSASAHGGSIDDTYGFGASAGLGSSIQVFGFHDFASGEGERTKDQSGFYLQTWIVAAVVLMIAGARTGANSTASIPQRIPGLNPVSMSFGSPNCSLK